MHQVCEYPDSTISKVLTILKWQMITTLNRKLLEKESVQRVEVQSVCSLYEHRTQGDS